jgi:CRISPR-associated protein Cas1
MSSAASVIRDEAFRQLLEQERARPVQRNLFTGEPDSMRVELASGFPEDETVIDDGVSVVKTDDMAQLIVSGFGLYLGKKSERLVVRKDKSVVYQFPFFRIQEVVVASRGISISADLLEELCVRGIRINFWGGAGKPYAVISSPYLNATIQTRRDQLVALTDSRGFEFARAIVEGKVRNQEKVVRYFGKYLKSADAERFKRVSELSDALRASWKKARDLEGDSIESRRAVLMGIEGAAGRLYWDAVSEVIGGKTEFMGREHRGATNAVNAMLNYGYGILYGHVWGAVLNAGLEPFAGFLHVDRSGKPSLVLDLVEEFRQPVVDRAVLSAVNLGMSVRMENGMLDKDSRDMVASRVLERLVSAERHLGKEYQVRSIIQMQARKLASFLRGGSAYRSFRFKW